MARLSAPITPRLADVDVERMRREHDLKIVELQGLPASSMLVISGVTLANGVTTPVNHGLGRVPVWIRESTIRGATTAGYLIEIRDTHADRTHTVQLQANGYGATITIDLAVM